ncbi:hypothetical protein [Lacinutrix chionoecetis]
MKIALIDGLPLKPIKGMSIINNNLIPYSWDSECFGVPEFRKHSTNMLNIIFKENPNADVTVFPFFPKYNSVLKNYKLIAQNIGKAVDLKCNIICICLEVIGATYLSSDVIKAYKYAYANNVLICVSAGNNRLLNNPLIHKKYAIPIVGFLSHISLNISYKIDFLDEVETRKLVSINSTYSINCSKATAQFVALLSKKPYAFLKNNIHNKVIILTYE